MNKKFPKLLIFNRMTPETMQVKENAMYSLRETRQNHLAKVEYEKEKKEQMDSRRKTGGKKGLKSGHDSKKRARRFQLSACRCTREAVPCCTVLCISCMYRCLADVNHLDP